MEKWSLDAGDGELRVLTGVAGRAAKMGHRLTIGMKAWAAEVQWAGDSPTHAELTVPVDSFEVVGAEGGVTPLAGSAKGLVRANALKVLDAKKFPEIRFVSDEITKTAAGYRMSGTLEIHGTSRPQVVDVTVKRDRDGWDVAGRVTLSQSDFGVKPYSLFMGSVKVADEVTVDFHASRPA